MKKRIKEITMFYGLHFIAIIFSALIVVALSKAVWSLYLKYKYSNQKLDALGARLEHAKSRQNEIINKMEYVKSDFGKEEILRDNYSLAKKGERVIILIQDDKERKEKKLEKKSFWNKIKQLFAK